MLKNRHKILILTGTFILYNIAFMPPVFRNKFNIKEGGIASYDVIAPYNFSVPRRDEELREERAAIERRMPPIYEVDNNLLRTTARKLEALAALIDSLKKTGRTQTADALVQGEYHLPPEAARYLVRSSHRAVLKRLSGDLVRVYAPWILDERPIAHRIITIAAGDRETVEAVAAITTVAEAESALAGPGNGAYAQLVRHFLLPNLTYSEARTEQRIEEVFSSVPRIKSEILKGEIIVEKHKRVNATAVEIIRAMEQTYISLGTWDIVKTMFFRNLVFFAMIFLLFHYRRMTKIDFFAGKSLYFIALLFAVYLIIGKVAYEADLIYLVPIACFIFILALYFNFPTAMFFNMLLASIFGIVLGSLQIFIFLLISGLVAGFSSQTIHTRLSLYRPMIYMAVTNVLVILFIDLYLNKAGVNLLSLGAGILNSGISNVAVAIALPLVERLFDFTTDLTLLELGNLNLPIFKEMSLNSAGTFHHSVVVGNLAEAGASAIGADPILARVGAYYHDIGKIKKADYYIENQLGVKNPHDHLKPQMSALVIISHVKEGIDMARDMRLPRKLAAIIAEHHGTTRVELFYKKALHLAEEVHEDAFRYPGPKPKSKEAALVMLADSVEAAARSEKNISVTKLQKIIKDNFDRKFNDGQLDDCPINRYDLELLKAAFLPILNGIFHPRVEYEENATGTAR